MKLTTIAAILYTITPILSSPLVKDIKGSAVLGDPIVVHADLFDSDIDLTATSNLNERGTSSAGESSLEKRQNLGLINQMIAYHNAYRAHHGALKMSWSTTLATYAQNSASACVFQHTANDPYGENIAAGTYNNPAYYVYLWYNEVTKYNFNAPGYSSSTGHFTQVVWNASTQLGCAWVTGCKGSYPNMLFCEYGPRGNVLPASNFATNVGKPLASPANPAVPPENV